MNSKKLSTVIISLILFGTGYFLIEGGVFMGLIPNILGCGMVGAGVGMFGSAFMKKKK